MVLDVHLEGIDDNGEKLVGLAESGKPFSISLVPVLFLPNHNVFGNGVYPRDYYYPKKIVEVLREFAKNPNVSFGQQGFTHYCPDCYGGFIKRGGREKKAWPDPWHENKCLYEGTKSVDEQAEIMKSGKRVIENILEKSPVMFVPPNHQYDRNTKRAAQELEYDFFATRGVLNLEPYREERLLILPERDLSQGGDIVFTHYDRMGVDFEDYLNVVRNSTSLEEINFNLDTRFKEFLNERLILGRKLMRDLFKAIR